MPKKIKILVPYILRDRGITLDEFRWGSMLSLNTARRWFNPIASMKIMQIDMYTLTNIAKFLQIDDISQLIQFE